jgi:hypothetical protein
MEAAFMREEFGFGNYIGWLDENQIAVVFGTGNMRPTAVDTWSEAVRDVIHQFPGTGAIYLLLQLDQPSQGFTPYTRQKVLDLYQHTTDERPIFVAVVLRNTLTSLIITSFIKYAQMNQLKPNMHPQIFSSHDKALAWLRQMREQETTQ